MPAENRRAAAARITATFEHCADGLAADFQCFFCHHRIPAGDVQSSGGVILCGACYILYVPHADVDAAVFDAARQMEGFHP
jgi:hypothetical protein